MAIFKCKMCGGTIEFADGVCDSCGTKQNLPRLNDDKKAKKIARIIAPVVAIVVVFIILLNSVIIPEYKMNKVMDLLISSNYDSAYALLEGLGDSDEVASSKYNIAIKLINSSNYEPAYMLLSNLSYKDSAQKLQSIKPKYQQILLSRANVGDTIFFGAYEQDNNTSNGKEDIEWHVLAKENNRIFVISDEALDCQKNNSSFANVTWENCSIRKWLNETFFYDAFSDKEQSQIQSTNVPADNNPKHNANPGNTTTDKVFLLSIAEAQKYLTSSEDAKCVPTAYAIAQGAYTSSSYTKDEKPTCWWWLRSPGVYQNRVTGIFSDGSVYFLGFYVTIAIVCVRPAMWISLAS